MQYPHTQDPPPSKPQKPRGCSLALPKGPGPPSPKILSTSNFQAHSPMGPLPVDRPFHTYPNPNNNPSLPFYIVSPPQLALGPKDSQLSTNPTIALTLRSYLPKPPADTAPLTPVPRLYPNGTMKIPLWYHEDTRMIPLHTSLRKLLELDKGQHFIQIRGVLPTRSGFHPSGCLSLAAPEGFF